MRLTLVVNNTRDLNGGTKASHVFDKNGGVVGAAPNVDWVLSDRSGSIEAQHVRAVSVDGAFCIEVLASCGVSVNGSKTPVKRGDIFQVSDGDILKVGIFSVSAYVTVSSKEKGAASSGEKWARRFVSVGALVGDMPEDQIEGNDLFQAGIMKRDANVALQERLALAQKTDPVLVLEDSRESRTTSSKDPVSLFDREQKAEGDPMATSVDEYLKITPEKGGTAELPDDLQPGSAYFAAPKAIGRSPVVPVRQGEAEGEMDSYLETLAQSSNDPRKVRPKDMENAFVRDSWAGTAEIKGESDEEQLVDHVVLRPLCAALGLPIQSMTVPQANRLARDVGEALKAAIAGIMDNHQRELSDKSHLAETHLHAIEDNPLRLEKSAEEAVRDLFLVQSPVHLSASAAIGESLLLLRHHQEASEAASEAALEAVLHALAPLALAKRFKKYKGHAPRAGDLDAWHWTMYQHYYAEMRTHQQGGLSRMFWEVYRQVYDREMRRLTDEG